MQEPHRRDTSKIGLGLRIEMPIALVEELAERAERARIVASGCDLWVSGATCGFRRPWEHGRNRATLSLQ